MKTFKTLLFATLMTAASVVSAKTIEIGVNGLVCAFCAQGIEKTLRTFPATADVFVSLENRIVAIELADGKDIDDATLDKAITDAGYTVVSIRRDDGTLQAIRDRVARADDE